MKRKRHYISLGWVVVAVLVSIAIHAFSHQEVRQEESQEVTTTQQQSEGSWTTMPDSVVEMCMAAPLKTVPEQVVRRTAYVASYNKRTRCPNWVAWLLTAEHTDGELKRMNNFHEDEECPLPRRRRTTRAADGREGTCVRRATTNGTGGRCTTRSRW